MLLEKIHLKNKGKTFYVPRDTSVAIAILSYQIFLRDYQPLFFSQAKKRKKVLGIYCLGNVSQLVKWPNSYAQQKKMQYYD